MYKHTTLTDNVRDEIHLTIDDLVRRGAQRMLEAALQAEVETYLQRHRHERDNNGHALVVRNGLAQERTVQCGAGQIKIKAPRVHDKRDGQKFTSHILPPYMRKTPRLEEAVPVLYLRGLSTGDFQEALSALLGRKHRWFLTEYDYPFARYLAGRWLNNYRRLSKDYEELTIPAKY